MTLAIALAPAQRSWLAAALAVIVCSALWLMATGGRVAYTQDSFIYRDAVLNMLAGYPMQATNLLAESPERVPLLKWPPGYPALWALASSLTGQGIDAIPGFLNPLLLALTTLSFFWATLQLTGSRMTATAFSIVSYLMTTSLPVFGHAWSETIFMPLSLFAFAFLWRAGETPAATSTWGWTLAAAIVIGYANLVRYSASPLVLLMIMMILLRRNQPIRPRLLRAMAATCVTLAICLPVWLRNLKLTGNVAGGSRGPALDPWGRLTGDLVQFGELVRHTLSGFDTVLQAHVEPILIVLLVLAMLMRLRMRQSLRIPIPRAVWVPLAWGGANFLGLLGTRALQQQIDFDLRMLVPAAPYFLMALALPFSRLILRPAGKLEQAMAICLLTLLVHTGLQEIWRVNQNYASGNPPLWRANFSFNYRDRSLHSPEARDLKEAIGNLTSSTIILTDVRPLYVRYLTDIPAYEIRGPEDCNRWKGIRKDVVLLAAYPEDDPSMQGNPWLSTCRKLDAGWKVVIAPRIKL